MWDIQNTFNDMILVYILEFYLFSGIAFALYFIFLRLKKLDAAAQKTSVYFKFLIFWGVVLLWPALLMKKEISHI